MRADRAADERGKTRSMAPKITALLALATAFAAPVFDFDETTITSSTKPAFVLITPQPCEGSCEALVNLWTMAADKLPMMYRQPRSGCPAASATLCNIAARSADTDVVFWNGRAFEAYAGPRNAESLAEAIMRAAQAPVVQAPGRDAHEPSLACLEKFLARNATAAVGVSGPDATPFLRPDDVDATPFLRPEDVAAPELYAFDASTTWRGVAVDEGTLRNPSIRLNMGFGVARAIVSPSEVAAIRAVVDSPAAPAFDGDPDSVDGIKSHEIFVDNDDLRARDRGEPVRHQWGKDSDPAAFDERRKFRRELSKILDPILAERLTPYVNERYAAQCGGHCSPCYSLIRRYEPEARTTHEPHHDAHSLVTVVVSLADYGSEYTGGIYLVGPRSVRSLVALDRGDAIAHQYDLHHGVDVASGTRWSWILWYRDSATCEDKSDAWFAACAENGNAVCQNLHAGQTHLAAPGAVDHRVDWTRKAAENGMALAMLKLGRAYLKRLPSSLPLDAAQAAGWFRQGVQTSQDPACAFDLAQLLVAQRTARAPDGEIRDLLELAAKKGHTYAAFNLGLAHLFGHAGLAPDADAAAAWFLRSGLPEGLRLGALRRRLAGDADGARKAMDRAVALGVNEPWRAESRAKTGSGGAGGSPLYTAWPDACGGE